MHIIPQLRKLERKYRDSLVVIGVHSSKFPNERETRNVREAVLRYEIEHPVVNDAEFQVWQSWGVRAWPTLMFVDPEGRALGKHEGEFAYDQFDALIGEMVAEYEAAGLLDRTPLAFQLEAAARERLPLYFPGKIEADPAGERLLIADSNHNRIVVSDRRGRVQAVVGSGEAGAADGSFESASFWHPQGMAVDGDLVYVADAENHLVRSIDLATRTVATIAGTGEQALYRHQGGDALAYPLSSPYDLALHAGVLYIAMAGVHQLWAIDLAASRVYPYAGSGRENIVDGPLLEAQLAQPYGIATDGERLYFADSETSALRSAGFGPDARVETLVGRGLFDFGDVVGAAPTATLQHVQGLALGPGVVYLADTYNHKIKAFDLASGEVRTLAGTPLAGQDDGAAETASFNEPAGLARLGDDLFIADTNNHAIRVLNLITRRVATLDLTGL
jgi:DNA-binding beta-propeller fold protein YncE